MKSRVFLGIGLLILLIVITISTTLFWNKSSNAQNFSSKISIQIEQLPSEKGKIPVEMKCKDVELAIPNELEKLPCEAVNNTDKEITAMVVTYSISIKENEKDSSQSGAITIEALLHPDFYK